MKHSGIAATFADPGFLPGRPVLGADQVTWLEMFFLSGTVIGMGIIWLLLLLSAFSIGFMIMLFIQYRREAVVPEQTREEVEALLAEKRYREAVHYLAEDPSYLGRLAHAALLQAENGYGEMERAIEEAGDAETTRFLRPVEYLNVVGNISPMIGLFGTVYGMIVAFQELVAAGGSADPAELAGGISTALVTTFWGLVVAIPALAGYSLLRNKIDALSSEGMLAAEELIGPFKPGRRGRQGDSSAARAGEGASL